MTDSSVQLSELLLIKQAIFVISSFIGDECKIM